MLGLLVKDLRIALTRKFALLIILVIALIMGTSMEGPFIIGCHNDRADAGRRNNNL